MKTSTIVIGLLLVCLALCGAGALWLGPVYLENGATRESIGLLRTSFERQAQEIERLNRELRELRTDYRAIERVAREKFGMCLPGEDLYHFEEPPATGKDAGKSGAAAGEAGVPKAP
jgi:cell division protein FtsB